MFCGECGAQNPDNNAFCKNCGKPLKRSSVQGLAPGSAQPVLVTPPAQASPGTVTVLARVDSTPVSGIIGTIRSKKALVASIVCGVLSALVLPYLLGTLAIILGIWVVHKKDRRGVIGILLGLAVILLDYFYLVIFP
ncbi:MAG: zinc ribbon domain-containing protein [Methanoregula sp.]|nr:zinc ribbon domain-containing protein [Methanoregula sp.]